MQVHTIKNSLLQSCTYLLYDDTDGVFLIDCGEFNLIKKWLDENHKKIKGIFITHCHYDHIYGLSQLLMDNPKVPIYASVKTLQGIQDDEKNLSYILGGVTIHIGQLNGKQIEEGLSSFETMLVETLFTPGHSDDCYSYIIGNKIFTGDSYIPHAKVFAKWPSSNRDLALKNETRIKDIIKQRNLTVYSGHWY